MDQLVLDLLRRIDGMTISDLVERLEVTQTAVRLRLERLEQYGLIEKSKQSVGRGRPLFKYSLTSLGTRQAGASYADLAMAVWAEIDAMPECDAKNQIVRGVARRMGQSYAKLLPEGSLANRLESIARLLTQKKIPSHFDHRGSLPILTVEACPFPELAAVDRRSACELEQQVLSEAVGHELKLSCCRLDGHESCQFQPV